MNHWHRPVVYGMDGGITVPRERTALLLGVLLVLLAFGFFARTIAFAGGLFVLLALGFVVAHLTGMAGRWALAAGAACGVIALPSIFYAGFRLGVRLLAVGIRLLPLALILLGIYAVIRALARRG